MNSEGPGTILGKGEVDRFVNNVIVGWHRETREKAVSQLFDSETKLSRVPL